MKKYLLSLFFGLALFPFFSGLQALAQDHAAFVPKRATGTFDFGYGSTPNGYIGTQAAETYDVCIFVPSDYAGRQITAVSFYLHQKAIVKDVIGWASASLPTSSSATDCHANLEASKMLSYEDGINKVEFAMPYTIPEKGCYAGYSLTVTSAATDYGKYPIMLDRNACTDGGMFLKTSRSLLNWDNYYQGNYGNLVIRVTISGEFADNAVLPNGSFADAYGAKNATADAAFTITNQGSNPLENFSYIVKSADGQSYEEQTFMLPEPLAFESSMTVKVPVPTQSTTGRSRTSIYITKANGTENPNADKAINGTVVSLSRLATRRVLEEEFTGVTCGWCPRGITGMDECKKQLGDQWIGAALHLYAIGDPMYPCTYSTDSPYYSQSKSIIDVKSFFTGAPQCMLNRLEKPDPYYGDENHKAPLGIIDECRRVASVPPVVDLKVDAAWTDDNRNKIDVYTSSEFLLDDNSIDRYSLAYYVIGDGIYGPSWKQSNYFSGYEGYEDDPYLSEWVYKASYVTGIYFNHVALAGFGCKTGLSNSIKNPVHEGEVQTHHLTMDLSGNKFWNSYPEIDFLDKNNVSVIAFILDKKTGEVVNAAQTAVSTTLPEAVESVTVPASSTLHYDLSGRRISPSSPGLHIVNGRKHLLR